MASSKKSGLTAVAGTSTNTGHTEALEALDTMMSVPVVDEAFEAAVSGRLTSVVGLNKEPVSTVSLVKAPAEAKVKAPAGAKAKAPVDAEAKPPAKRRAKAAAPQADAPLAEVKADAPHAEAHADAPLAEADADEALLASWLAQAEADEAAASSAWDEALAMLADEAEAAAKAAIEALASTAAEAVAKAKAKVTEAAAYAAKCSLAEVWAKASATAFGVAEAEAGAVATALTLAEAEGASVRVTKALREVERTRAKAQSAADKARKEAGTPAPAPTPATASVGDEPPINAVMAEALAKAKAKVEVEDEVEASDEVKVEASDEVKVKVEASDEDELPLVFGLGAIPMPTVVRADALTSAVLDCVNRMSQGRLLPLLQIPADAEMSAYEASRRAAEVKGLIESLGTGGKVLVSTIITVGSRQHRIVIATIISVRVIGSVVEIKGIALTTNGSLAIGGTNAPFAGVLQFDREAVVVGEMEVDPAFSFAPPTLKVVAVAQSVAPKASKVTAPAPVAIHNRDGSRTAADRPIRGNSVVGYSR